MQTALFNRGNVAQTGIIRSGGQLITDSYPLEILDTRKGIVSDVLSEAAQREIPVTRVTGIFQRCDIINANGRMYPSEVLNAAIQAIKEDVQERGVLGEFDHPADAKVHFDRVSHVITKLWLENKIVMGEMEILEKMPCGQMLKALFESKVRVGVSSRGVGDMDTTFLEGEEVYRVLPGYRFVTFDAVAEPSVPGSYLTMMESKQRKVVQNIRKRRETQILEEIRKVLGS